MFGHLERHYQIISELSRYRLFQPLVFTPLAIQLKKLPSHASSFSMIAHFGMDIGFFESDLCSPRLAKRRLP